MSIDLWPFKGVGVPGVVANFQQQHATKDSATNNLQNTNEPNDDCDDILFDLPSDDDIAHEMVQRFGLKEVPGGIGIDSCASDNVMARRHLPGY